MALVQTPTVPLPDIPSANVALLTHRVPVDSAPTKNLSVGQILGLAQVDSIALLRSAQTSAGRHVVVTGYYASGDGGGGEFLYSASSVADDDTCSVIEPDSGVGRWIRVPETTFDLRATGADPTAALDCRNQFQRALNYCRRVGAQLVVTGDFRVASTKPIYVGNVSIRGDKGRIFNSLPDDYTWSAYSTDSYEASGVIDLNGFETTWSSDPALPSGRPWNGKTNMFEAVTRATITNLYIDGGWWYSNGEKPSAYPSAKSIRGIKGDSDEMTYYQLFSGSTDAVFDGVIFKNSPGAMIETGNRVKVVNSYFGEYGDHVFYFGGGTDGFIFSNNQIRAVRTASGVSGTRDYIYQVNRNTTKFRGCSNVVVSNNMVLAPSAVVFVDLECSSIPGQAFDCTNVDVSGNVVNGCSLFLAISDRGGSSPYGSDGVGYYIKNVTISGNTVSNAGPYFGNFFQAAVENFYVRGNTFVSTGSGWIAFLPSSEYANPIRSLYIQNNTFKVLSGQVIPCGGPLWGPGTFVIENNKYFATNFDSTNGFLNFSSIYHSTSELDSVHFTSNTGINLFSLWLIGGTNITWVATNDYSGFERTYADGDINRGDIVLYSGVYYRARASIPGNVVNSNPSADAANWAVYTRQTTKISITKNVYTCATSSDYLLYFLRGNLGFLPSVYAADNRTNNLNGTVPQYLLKAGTCNDTVDNSLSDFPAQRVSLANDGTSTDGFVLDNRTPATAGNQKPSPRLRLRGNGWKTDAAAASQPVDFIMEAVPIQGAANPSVDLVLKYSINGGAYTELCRFSKTNGFVLGNFSIGNNGIFAGGGTNQESTFFASGVAGACLQGATFGSSYELALIDGSGQIQVVIDKTNKAWRHLGTHLGFYNGVGGPKPTITGSRGGNAALASLLTQLAAIGLLTDSSS